MKNSWRSSLSSSPRRRGPRLDSFLLPCHFSSLFEIEFVSKKTKVLSLGPRLRGDDEWGMTREESVTP